MPEIDMKVSPGPRRIIVVTGSVGGGKTSLVEEAAHLLKTEGVSVAGVITPVLNEAGKRVGYIIRDLRTGEERILARTTPFDTPLRQCSFYFVEESFRWAEKLFSKSLDSQVFILDEVGRLELRRKGYYRLLESILLRYEGCFIITARRDILAELIALFKIERAAVIDIETEKEPLILLKELVKAALS
ncbi:MAG: nucleoside-triphosphatase [Acidobacteriota bacterium]